MRPLFDRPIAHRGLHDPSKGVIENSRSAFEAAIVSGYAIECDVQLSSDGVPFIFHDDTFDRLTSAKGPSNGLPINEVVALGLTGSSNGDTPQRFDAFLDQVAGRTLLQIELKHQADPRRSAMLASAVAKALKSYVGPYTLESFDPRLIADLRRSGVTAPIGIVTYRYDDDSEGVGPIQAFILRHLLHWPWTKFDFISSHDGSLDLPAIRFFRSRGMPVTAWTIRSAGAARAALQAADQIVFEGFEPQSA
ncbi:MAG TPA: glycerophosphodiester phosphodiesterase family protein [Devosia sp.]|nr:glycerophosphodiester phosphodiesterase family protein [Devosia sp.]